MSNTQETQTTLNENKQIYQIMLIDFADWFKEITMRNLLNELDWDTDYLNLCTGRVSKNLASTYDATVQDWWDEAQNIWNDPDLDEDETEVAIHDYIDSLNWNSIVEKGISWLINYVDEDDYAGIWDKVQSYKKSINDQQSKTQKEHEEKIQREKDTLK